MAKIILKYQVVYGIITDEPRDPIKDSESFKSKTNITRSTPNDNHKKRVENAVTLKYLSNFWRTLKMPLINCEITLNLTWPKDCVITDTAARAA